MEAAAPVDIPPEVLHNVILHLRCNSSELKHSRFDASGGIEPYTSESGHAVVASSNDSMSIQQKVSVLATNLHTNEINARSDCFWCTFPYDCPTVFIPKCRVGEQYQVYGSFCCPECAAAYLLNEGRLDMSTRYERYHLMNYMYAQSCGYTKNIVPAPPPFYLLSKYFGDLSIDEYRTLIRKEPLVLVVDKPICSSYPEILQGSAEFSTPVLSATKPEETTYRLCRKKR